MKKVILFTFFTMILKAGLCQLNGIYYVNTPFPNILRLDTGQNTATYDFDDNGDKDFWIGIVNYRWYHVEGYTLGDWQFYNEDFLWNQFVNEGDTLSMLQESYWRNAPEKLLGRKDRINRIYVWEGESVDSVIVAVRKPVNEDFYYGWVRFSVIGDGPSSTLPNNTTCIIHDYAYCTIPNYPLRAGQTSLSWGMDENASVTFATIHPNPTTGLVTIVGKDLNQAEVVNMLGQCVTAAQGKGETLQIDISNLPTGVYFVNVTDGEGRKCVRKVVKE